MKVFNKIISQHSKTFKNKIAFTTIIQQIIIEFYKLANINSTLIK